MHENSKAIYTKIMKDGSKDARFKKVFEIIYFSKQPLRDWDVLQRFKLGSDNLNLVQPRISEGYKPDKADNPPIYQEGPPGISPHKNTPVRTTVIASDPDQAQQQSLL